MQTQDTHLKTLLMDRQTLLAHAQQWGEEPQPTRRELSSLTPEESALYDDLRDNRLQKNCAWSRKESAFAGWSRR